MNDQRRFKVIEEALAPEGTEIRALTNGTVAYNTKGKPGYGKTEEKLNSDQLFPQENNLPHVWDLVIKDMVERDNKGQEKYNCPLQPFNGREVLLDAYQEALDLAVYLRQLIYEKYGE